MSWNYRALRYDDGSIGLHEVYYRPSKEVEGYPEFPAGFVGESKWSILRQMARAAWDMLRQDCVDYSYEEPIPYEITPAGHAMREARK